MILVVGCGYVGEKVADLLHEQGLAVTGVTHSPESAARLCAEKPWRAVACDISLERSVQRLARTVGADQVKWVVHCASSNRGGAEVYQQVYEQGMDHLMLHFSRARPLFTSSTSVYPQTDGSTVTETCPAEPDKETGRILRRTEQNVLRLKGTVARLAGIYGPGRSFLLRHLLEGKSSIEGNEGQGRIINQIHRLDAASAVVHLIQNNLTGIYNAAITVGRIFLVPLLVVVLMTNPISSHALARAAHAIGIPMTPQTGRDALREARQPEEDRP